MRAGIYYRVSTEEQVEGFSLDAQRRALIDFCAARDWTVADEYADEGKSARGGNIAERPQFKRMMEDAEAGVLDVVVVHKLDRFSRNMRVTIEQFEVLHRHGVTFASVAEQGFDFTTPMGKVTLALLSAFAQYYSDNLSQETTKGKAERKKQGLYNGWLPFGVKKNSDGIPVPDPATYPGLLLAFQTAADGKSDREVATLLNDRGYRTTGNRGQNPFSKDTVRPMLQNRFYLGELPDGEGGWLPGAHDAVLDDELFDAAQAARGRRASTPLPVRRGARVYALSGLLRCHHCGGTLHIHTEKGRERAYCYRGRQAAKCAQKSTFLSVYEEQIGQHLATFRIPEDYREQLLAAQVEMRASADEGAEMRKRLETQLANARALFELGDIAKADYLARRERLQREIANLRTADEQGATLERAAAFLTDLPAAWASADQEQRNMLARLLFEEIHVKDKWVVAVKPQPTFVGFFGLDCQSKRLSGGSDGARTRGLCLDRAAC
jgi:site-specific DNA recombinase